MTETAAPVRSYSQLNTLRMCGEMYRLRKVERLPEWPAVFTIAGSAVHAVCDYIDNQVELSEDAATVALEVGRDYMLAEAAAQEIPTERWNFVGLRPKQTFDWWMTTGLPNASAGYLRWRLANRDLVIATIDNKPGIELPFSIQLGGVEVVGYIDRVFWSTSASEYLILDFKSGAKPKTTEQLGLYSWALLDQYKVDAINGMFLYQIKSGNIKESELIDLRHWTGDMLSGLYAEGDRQIREGIFLPNPGEHCNLLCGYRGICEYAKATRF